MKTLRISHTYRLVSHVYPYANHSFSFSNDYHCRQMGRVIFIKKTAVNGILDHELNVSQLCSVIRQIGEVQGILPCGYYMLKRPIFTYAARLNRRLELTHARLSRRADATLGTPYIDPTERWMIRIQARTIKRVRYALEQALIRRSICTVVRQYGTNILMQCTHIESRKAREIERYIRGVFEGVSEGFSFAHLSRK